MSDGRVESTFTKIVSWLADCEALPADIDAKARLLLLDTLGCMLAGLRHPDVVQFGYALQRAFPGDVIWPGSNIALGAAGGAALGAAAACWDEACEGHASAHGRPGLPVVPSLLALAADRDASLADLLLALVTGYEIGVRAGQAWRIPAGLHVDGSWHSLAVAAAAARLTSGPDKIQPAIEAAACQIPASLYLPVAAGSVVRNTFASHAALLGLLSAAAAEAGFDAPADALEEARFRVLQAAQPAQVAPAGEWTIRDGYLKPFAGVRHTHYGVEAALRIRRKPDFALKNVRAIRLRTYEEAARYCGNRAPHTAIQAQFSLSYAVAAALVLGDLGPEAYADMGAGSAIMRLEKTISVDVDPRRVRRGADLAVDTGAAVFTEIVDVVAGDPEQPMRVEDVKSKFARYVEPALGVKRAAALTSFFLEGDSREPARNCFAIAG
ncbi:MmgE/PrpD family protein [Bradyrhizobium sp. LHD-71]|uniref:MmgE/PrpD family protein n=1 Tax=Bradyrhizobium sp. LHD-71 TaxID=3072141 RepID=UPI00280E32AF|nr:MmgE/PrpD family protein [Bradyrhizobium sp. LHD-71]MDQ8727510.1 MmgE/PrpD family protein [Bradyrhizobium sp. LHD-71]